MSKPSYGRGVELTSLERDEQVERWIELTEQLQSRQLDANESKRADGRFPASSATRDTGLTKAESVFLPVRRRTMLLFALIIIIIVLCIMPLAAVINLEIEKPLRNKPLGSRATPKTPHDMMVLPQPKLSRSIEKKAA